MILYSNCAHTMGSTFKSSVCMLSGPRALFVFSENIASSISGMSGHEHALHVKYMNKGFLFLGMLLKVPP